MHAQTHTDTHRHTQTHTQTHTDTDKHTHTQMHTHMDDDKIGAGTALVVVRHTTRDVRQR